MTTFPVPTARPAMQAAIPWRWITLTITVAVVLPLCGVLILPAAQAHHLLEITGLPPTPLSGLLSGLAHPVLGPDHLLFLLALSLAGLRHRVGWMLALLACGLGGSALGLILPGVAMAEALVAFSLVVVGMVLIDRWPRGLLLPAFLLHGYVLSAAVIGWSQKPILAYLVGLLISQTLLLLASLTLLRRLATGVRIPQRQLLAAGLIGCGLAWTWSGLVG